MRYRVLLIAEAANPEWVSVPLVGWSIANALRDVADVHIVTQIRNRDAFLRQGLIEGEDFTAIDSERLARPVHKIGNVLRGGEGKGWTTLAALSSLSYFYFERLVWRTFGARIKAGEFDIVHRVTPLSPTAPSSLSRRCAKVHVPFVLGPLNGGLPWPKEFDAERRKEKEWLSYIRAVYKLMPGIKSTFRNASAIIAASRHTFSELAKQAPEKLVFIPENGIDAAKFHSVARARSAKKPIKLCYVGRLVPYKCPDVAIISAAKLLLSGKATLDLVGDGPMMGELKALVAQLGVERAVKFHGWVEQSEVAQIAGGQDFFLFPSVREFGGGAVLEAMAMGLVPIIVDYGGPGEIVSPETGFKVPMREKSIVIQAIASLLEEIVGKDVGVDAISKSGLARVADLYTWPKKAEQIGRVYDWVCNRSAEKPDFEF
jgi:glycosyltransferase involved in cell wall biosynthesis